MCVLTVTSIVDARSFTSRHVTSRRAALQQQQQRLHRPENPRNRVPARKQFARARARVQNRRRYGNRAKSQRRGRWRCSRSIRRWCQGRCASSLVSTQPGHGQPGRTSHTQRQRSQRAETADAGRDRAREAVHQSAGKYMEKKLFLSISLSF